MFGIHDFPLFLAAGILLTLTPGPDIALILGQAARGGSKAGVAAALGAGTGCLIHTALAAAGLSAILAASDTAFTAVKWLGAAYLVTIGARMVFSRAAPARAAGPAPLGQAFRQGVLTNALNPKVALFFLAFMPQFIDADAPSKPLSFMILGLAFNLTGTLFNASLGWLGGRAAGALRLSALGAWLERALGVMFIGLGLRLAFSGRG